MAGFTDCFVLNAKDPDAPAVDTSSAVARCGIARTKDLKTWAAPS
jgi:4-O-beta-D-mannosyl-D-glucose phosphorylase